MVTAKYYTKPLYEEREEHVANPFRTHPMYQKTFSWIFIYISLPFFMIVLLASILTLLDGMYHVISDQTVFTIFGLSLAGLGLFYLVSTGQLVKRNIEKYLLIRKEKGW